MERRRDPLLMEAEMTIAQNRSQSEIRKGPWSREEDEILISFIRKHGHANWRALPKLAGLSRCGKSCRLRWLNYLRPDIKRGNFTAAEEDIIIGLHEELGNRWSAIAARLPGRTDNEIKNVWHTHLKKRERRKSRSDDYSQQSFTDVPLTVDTMEETSMLREEFLESLDNGYLFPPVDNSMDFWRRLLMDEEVTDLTGQSSGS